jgi:uncharacterized membrane protein
MVYAYIAIARYHLQTVGPDAAIFDQAINGYAHLRAPDLLIKSVEPYNILGDHFSPALVLFAPLFRIAPSVITLLVLQAILFALAAGLLWHTAVHVLRLPRLPSGLLTAGYGISAGMLDAVDYDFHEVSLTVPLLAAALSRLMTGRTRSGVVLACLGLLVREDNAFLVIGLGLVFLVSRRRLLGVALIAGGAAAFALTTLVVIPHFNYAGKYMYWTSGGVSGSLADSLRGLMGTLPQSLSYPMLPNTLITLLLPFAFLPLLSRWTVMLLPLLTLRALSPNPAYWILEFHYNAVVSTVLAFAAADAVRRLLPLERKLRPPQLRAVMALFGTAVLAAVAIGPLPRYVDPSTYACTRCAALRSTIERIPRGEPVAADGGFVALLVDTHPTYLLVAGFVDSTGRPMRPDWVLLDFQSPDMPVDLRTRLAALGYRETSARDGYILLRRGRSDG